MWASLGFTFGIWAGASISFWLMARNSPPAWIEQWQQGAFGEQATGKQLKKLESEGWVVLHDLPRGTGNVDHVLVEPGGVFVLDSKRTDGRVVVEDGTVTVTRLDDPELHFVHTGTPHLLRLARETHDRMRARSRINQWVTPVMVWWADFPQGVVEGRCAHVHGEKLIAWLRARPQQIAHHDWLKSPTQCGRPGSRRTTRSPPELEVRRRYHAHGWCPRRRPDRRRRY